MKSVWLDSTDSLNFDSLKGDKKTDVLVIGGGIAGVLSAYKLKKSGIDCILLESDKICNGITKNTTAKITVGHGLIYKDIIDKYGIDFAKLYFNANKKALEEYQLICKEINADSQVESLFIYSLDDEKKLSDEALALSKIGYCAQIKKFLSIPLAIKGALEYKNQLSINPIKFINAIAKDLEIYENTVVKRIENNVAITPFGNIKADKIIVATHFPFINKYGNYFLKMYQHRSYVIALKIKEKYDGMFVDENLNGLTFRNYGDYLLLGGGGHRTGKKGGGFSELIEFAYFNYPDYQMDYQWATQDCMTLDGIPYIGKYSSKTPNLYVATGFNKWGMTNALVSSNILKDMVCDKPNEYEYVFSPSRSIIHPQLISNIFESFVNFIRPTLPRCTHMGCALRYNKQEHSWDCPCHGSRYSENKKVIDNPAKKDL